ncbi:MAG: hypothetical protein AAGI23_08925 [Bacteroidota bacterium]
MIVLGGTDYFRPRRLERPNNHPRFIYFPSEFTLGGRGARFFEQLRRQRFDALCKKIKTVAQEEQIGYIIGIYPDSLYCLAACRVAKELGIPFASYFHNTYVENVHLKEKNAEAIQAEIFEASTHIFVMSKGMQRFYEQKYQLDKFVPLVHTFDDYPAPNSLSGIPGSNKSTYHLVAIGNFNESNIDATRRLINAIKNNPKYELDIYTHVPKLLLQQRGLDTVAINHRGFVTPDQVHTVLQQYDIAILTHGFTGGYGEVEYQTIFPTRTIPLLLSGKPIFAHSPKGSFLNDFLMENECAELVDETDEKAIIAGLDRVADNISYQQQLVEAARRTADQFYGKRVVKFLKVKLQEKRGGQSKTTPAPQS